MKLNGTKEESQKPSARIEEILRHYKSPFADMIGIRIDRLAESYCKLRLLLEEKCLNSFGLVHGGVLATMADMCMGVALRTAGLKSLTVELTVNFLSKPDTGDELTAEGWIVYRGNTIALTECIIKSGNDKDVARGRGIFKIS
ncbi:MAG: PaaI family thioesterase [Pelotomaculum sp.]|uniref:Thioesterase domain-containing protein n=1 Tax=Pelotomaculum thermopropionicum (strain DSM 13744 / JCM 10971 / SI) TaxID=370438 RepID=A5D254_PELTS|nr:PaaI family thioesterase [Pelotomaculum sp.]BAF59690.1 Uncharacterized protein PTH_1509 [Pelotomaculum thermopropionicum SI]